MVFSLELQGQGEERSTNSEKAATETSILVDALVSESQKHRVVREGDTTNPLRLAERAAVDLAGEVGQYNEFLLKILRRYAEQGDMKNVVYLADRLPGYGSAVAYADLALFAAKKHDKEAAAGYLKTAMDKLSVVSGKIAEQVRSSCAETLYLLGRESEAAALESQLGGLEMLELEMRLQKLEVRPHLTLKQAKTRLGELEEKGVDALRARFLLACAEHQLRSGDHSAGIELLPEAGRQAMADGLANGHRVLVDLARVAWAAGQLNEAEKALNLFLKAVGKYTNEVEWKPLYLAEAAELMLDWKREEQARAWLKEAESYLPNIFVLNVVKPTLAVARVLERLDGPAAGDRLAFQAARAGMVHPHPRAKGATATTVCLFYSDVGRKIPADILKVLNLTPETAG